ncbi:hypothetical protein [Rouxiella sp. WC2420]|uniref:Uncharacterized protein n=1 Tax=Rouxiella sp. WC2420 TaxID=3234145 RepID=A0AB39VWR4_9GAMM
MDQELVPLRELTGLTEQARSERAMRYIDKVGNFSHRVDRTGVYSRDISQPGRSANVFINRYDAGVWIFEQNFRPIKNFDYYASDVAKYQYLQVAQRVESSAVMPRKIIRQGVVNQITLNMTSGKQGDELFSAFFQTPNGKSTQRIMDNFSLVAENVEMEELASHANYVVWLKESF